MKRACIRSYANILNTLERIAQVTAEWNVCSLISSGISSMLINKMKGDGPWGGVCFIWSTLGSSESKSCGCRMSSTPQSLMCGYPISHLQQHKKWSTDVHRWKILTLNYLLNDWITNLGVYIKSVCNDKRFLKQKSLIYVSLCKD